MKRTSYQYRSHGRRLERECPDSGSRIKRWPCELSEWTGEWTAKGLPHNENENKLKTESK